MLRYSSRTYTLAFLKKPAASWCFSVVPLRALQAVLPPACPDATSGTVSGTVTVANVVGPNSQGITPGADFAKVVQAMRTGAAYVNVHSTRSPGGEIRGPVQAGDGDDQ